MFFFSFSRWWGSSRSVSTFTCHNVETLCPQSLTTHDQLAGYFPKTLRTLLQFLGYGEPPLFIRTVVWVVLYERSTTDRIHRIRQVIETAAPRWRNLWCYTSSLGRATPRGRQWWSIFSEKTGSAANREQPNPSTSHTNELIWRSNDALASILFHSGSSYHVLIQEFIIHSKWHSCFPECWLDCSICACMRWWHPYPPYISGANIPSSIPSHQWATWMVWLSATLYI
jgi:hypothetical protein